MNSKPRLVDVDDLCTVGDIARMAGVRNTAVSNWITRHDDFPQPLRVWGAGHFKVYSWQEVREWLTSPKTFEVVLPQQLTSRTLPARFVKEEDV
jgi:hypothetical protein